MVFAQYLETGFSNLQLVLWSGSQHKFKTVLLICFCLF